MRRPDPISETAEFVTQSRFYGVTQPTTKLKKTSAQNVIKPNVANHSEKKDLCVIVGVFVGCLLPTIYVASMPLTAPFLIRGLERDWFPARWSVSEFLNFAPVCGLLCALLFFPFLYMWLSLQTDIRHLPSECAMRWNFWTLFVHQLFFGLFLVITEESGRVHAVLQILWIVAALGHMGIRLHHGPFVSSPAVACALLTSVGLGSGICKLVGSSLQYPSLLLFLCDAISIIGQIWFAPFCHVLVAGTCRSTSTSSLTSSSISAAGGPTREVSDYGATLPSVYGVLGSRRSSRGGSSWLEEDGALPAPALLAASGSSASRRSCRTSPKSVPSARASQLWLMKQQVVHSALEEHALDARSLMRRTSDLITPSAKHALGMQVLHGQVLHQTLEQARASVGVPPGGRQSSSQLVWTHDGQTDAQHQPDDV